MRVYVVAESADEITAIRNICQENGWQLKVMRGIGRPTTDYPRQKVLAGFQWGKSVSIVAKELDIPQSTVRRILKEAGVLESN